MPSVSLEEVELISPDEKKLKDLSFIVQSLKKEKKEKIVIEKHLEQFGKVLIKRKKNLSTLEKAFLTCECFKPTEGDMLESASVTNFSI